MDRYFNNKSNSLMLYYLPQTQINIFTKHNYHQSLTENPASKGFIRYCICILLSGAPQQQVIVSILPSESSGNSVL